MRLPIFQIDAFASEVFAGNPAAVVPLDSPLPDAILQKIANENNLSETAFIVKNGDHYDICWFTPQAEIELCGHATLAAAFVVFKYLEKSAHNVLFRSRCAGDLAVAREGDYYILDFPSRPPRMITKPPGLARALPVEPVEVLENRKLVAVFDDPELVRMMRPDFAAVASLGFDGLVITAPGRDCDFVSRYFAPHLGIPEDPVTGSAHCLLTPWWAARLNKKRLLARQISARGGELRCELAGDRVKLAGRGVLYLEGFIYI